MTAEDDTLEIDVGDMPRLCRNCDGDGTDVFDAIGKRGLKGITVRACKHCNGTGVEPRKDAAPGGVVARRG